MHYSLSIAWFLSAIFFVAGGALVNNAENPDMAGLLIVIAWIIIGVSLMFL